MGQAVKIRPYEKKDREQILEMQREQQTEWWGDKVAIEPMDPDDPIAALVLVLEDDEGKIAAVLGAKRVVEVVMTMAPRGRDLAHFYRKQLIPMWAEAIVQLHRRGYQEIVAFVPEVIRKWGITLVKRAGFRGEPFRAFRFDIAKACNVKK